mmetsp:Transcript_39934/g.119521  ORF Transcript_39934/g.119521 Transcript_39934/m.119521 type:complete len:278 (-) Transcript_39934:933-1766(-)
MATPSALPGFCSFGARSRRRRRALRRGRGALRQSHRGLLLDLLQAGEVLGPLLRSCCRRLGRLLDLGHRLLEPLILCELLHALFSLLAGLSHVVLDLGHAEAGVQEVLNWNTPLRLPLLDLLLSLLRQLRGLPRQLDENLLRVIEDLVLCRNVLYTELVICHDGLLIPLRLQTLNLRIQRGLLVFDLRQSRLRLVLLALQLILLKLCPAQLQARQIARAPHQEALHDDACDRHPQSDHLVDGVRGREQSRLEGVAVEVSASEEDHQVNEDWPQTDQE